MREYLGLLMPTLYGHIGSATIDSFELVDCAGASAHWACCGCSSLLTSSPSFSSCFGASSAVILRSRVASSDFNAFSSSSLPHGFAMMASNSGTSVFKLAVRSSYWAMMSGNFSRALTKSVHSKLNYFGQREIALTNKNHLCFQFVFYKT